MISRLERAVNAWDFTLRRSRRCVVGVAGTKSVPETLIIIIAVVSLL